MGGRTPRSLLPPEWKRKAEGANACGPNPFALFTSIYMLQKKKQQNAVASKKIASIFNYALNHHLPEGQAVFRDIFTYLKAALYEHRAGCLVY
jgi:hypothetical protein